MNPERFERLSETRWRLPAQGRMQVPGEIYADEALLRAMDDKVAEKDVEAVVWAAEHAGLARVVARLEPLICIKG